MNVNIREAVPDDCDRISFVIKVSMGYDNPPSLIRNNIERIANLERDKVLVAEYLNQVIGFIHAEDYDCLYAPPLKDLMSLAVLPEYQHKKIGTRLLEAIEEWALETGRAGVRVISGLQRTDAHKFYVSRGYTLDKQQVNLKKFF